MYLKLKAEEVVRTASLLQRRIQERFPDSSLAKIAVEVVSVSGAAVDTVHRLGRPMWLLRLINLAFLLLTSGSLVYVLVALEFKPAGNIKSLVDFIQILEPALGAIVFVSAFVLLVWGAEIRVKRGRAFEALHELRSLAHTIDMHQLTKDPGRYLFSGEDTLSSPKRVMTPFQLNRYFDYCSEMLSLISKIAALYAQGFSDPEALEGVDQVEMLTTGLSRKIWQKIMVLDRYLQTQTQE